VPFVRYVEKHKTHFPFYTVPMATHRATTLSYTFIAYVVDFYFQPGLFVAFTDFYPIILNRKYG